MKNLLACDAFLTFGRRLSGKTLSARLTLCFHAMESRDILICNNAPTRRYSIKQIPCAEISQAEVCKHKRRKASTLNSISRQVCNNTALKTVQKAVFCMRKNS